MVIGSVSFPRDFTNSLSATAQAEPEGQIHLVFTEAGREVLCSIACLCRRLTAPQWRYNDIFVSNINGITHMQWWYSEASLQVCSYKRSVSSEEPNACSKGHELHPMTYRTSWQQCDRCHVAISVGQDGLRCSSCDYDVCASCKCAVPKP